MDGYFSVEEVIQILQGVLSNADVPPPEIPPPLVLLANINKKGLSAREVAKRIIARQAEAGAPVGQLPDGQESISEKMEYIRVQELLEHLIQNMRIRVVLPPGTPVVAAGVSASGIPVTVQGATTGLAIGTAIIQ